MDSIFKKPKLKAQNGRNAFDRSQKRVFHTPFGMILPCFFQRVNPNDYVELSCESQTICDKMARPAFIRLKEHINYYFVPAEMLWMPFDNFITGQDNYFSKAVEYYQNQSPVPAQVPLMANSFLWKTICEMSAKADIHGFNSGVNALRLLDLLGYGNWYRTYLENADADGVVSYADGNKLVGLPNLNLFGLLAYQKVYYDYYRNPKYEKNESSAYNIDDLSGNKILSNSDYSASLEKIFETHYAWAKKDYFMDVQPSILPTTNDIGYSGLVGNQPSSSDTNIWQIFGVPGGGSSAHTGRVGSIANATPNTQNLGNYVATQTGATGDVSALRFAFAYDKLLRRMREAGGTFDAQMLAQFGITPYDQRHGKCIYIGGQTNRLNCSDVVSTAETGTGSDSNLGYIGANINVYSAPRGKFKYHVKDHGFIIGMYHTSLDFDYPSYGLQRDNLAKVRFDWFNPAFENLGLQPIFMDELLAINPSYDDTWEIDGPSTAGGTNVLGFVRRYSEFKTNVDRVYGLFDFSQSVDKNAWVTQFFPWKYNDVGHKVPMRLDPLSQQAMVFTPLMFNQVVNTNYDGLWNTDHFDCHQYHHFKCISNMSSVGEVF